MLTADDKEEIKRLVGEVVARHQSSPLAADKYGQEIEDHILQNFIGRVFKG